MQSSSWTCIGAKTERQLQRLRNLLGFGRYFDAESVSFFSVIPACVVTGRDKVPKWNAKSFNKTFQKQIGLICFKSVPADLIINREPKFASCLAANVHLKSANGLEDHVLGVLKIRKQLHEEATSPITQLAIHDIE